MYLYAKPLLKTVKPLFAIGTQDRLFPKMGYGDKNLLSSDRYSLIHLLSFVTLFIIIIPLYYYS